MAPIGVGLLAALTLLVALGPRARFEGGWVEPALPGDVDTYLARAEADVEALRPGDGRGVVWADPVARDRTPIALVYLHGFSADRHEVEPLVSDLARDLSANVYFARLAGHGRDGSAMAEATTADWLADASEAVAIGARIGERVVVLGTSTGGTLALWAAARKESAGRIDALILISPNLGLRDRSARVLTWPWGGWLARAVVGAERCFDPESAEQARHWTVCYPTRALLPMAALVDHVRGMDLSTITVPTLVFYARGDQVVDSGETERVLGGLGGSGAVFQVVVGPGDPEQHVIVGSIMSPGTTDGIRLAVIEFLRRSGVSPGERG